MVCQKAKCCCDCLGRHDNEDTLERQVFLLPWRGGIGSPCDENAQMHVGARRDTGALRHFKTCEMFFGRETDATLGKAGWNTRDEGLVSQNGMVARGRK